MYIQRLPFPVGVTKAGDVGEEQNRFADLLSHCNNDDLQTRIVHADDTDIPGWMSECLSPHLNKILLLGVARDVSKIYCLSFQGIHARHHISKRLLVDVLYEP
ncbi:hypothetical protein E2C01_061837 [Portunus trituberculatus]|uniref:Uncharacterized protein n=1 Tax=Portunus trituberculatus TaxID=210409 RepID=A0A5B7HCZ0_PORTR|nr:hypothetical protein [Portunus trituberculatus]